MSEIPTIAVTMGDPKGVGSEIIQKALPRYFEYANFIVYGDASLNQGLPPEILNPITRLPPLKEINSEMAGKASVQYLEAAMEAFQRGEIQGLVTAPISKENVSKAGFPFPGHTEFLADQTGTQEFAMMLAGPKLRVTLVTIHEAIKNVSAKISSAKITKTIEITHRSLVNFFGIANPRIAVCGLNPHAGESGKFGTEEIDLIQPAIEKAAQLGFVALGPKVPDAVFHEAYQGKWDAVVCMYHDQGLIPFKMVHFEDGVNLTLGLPLVRTSPDHGTAFDIAGKGIANPKSMETAIRFAVEMCQRKILS